MIRQGFCETIGNTPLIEIPSLSAATGSTILGKAEFLNPGGSVKDRAALFMVLAAEKAGILKPGGTIVEGTAGNTGIGLTLVANARGYRSVIVMPSNQSPEKIDLLRTLGAEVELTPPSPLAIPRTITMWQNNGRRNYPMPSGQTSLKILPMPMPTTTPRQ